MWHELPAPEVCERARRSRDTRFDGRFFVAVLTTGIFCRPVCPARTPASENVRFYPTIAAALAAGYRPCLRCRPERAPAPVLAHAPAAARSGVVEQAVAAIEAGALDLGRIDALAQSLGLSERQLARRFVEELGVTPGAFAQARRVAVAKQLIDDTDLPFTDVAALAGFASLRRFNEAVLALWGRAPGQLRAARRAATSGTRAAERAAIAPREIRLTFALRQPYHRAWMLDYLRGRAVTGVESVDGDTWHRRVPGGAIAARLAETTLELTVSGDVRRIALADTVQRVRRVFDLAADPLAVDAQLATDARLRDVVAANPGLRVPGAWDAFELLVRAILGQQVSVAGATTLAGRLVARFGEAEGDGRLFPSAAALADASIDDIAAIGMPGTRAQALRDAAAAVRDGSIHIGPGVAPEALEGQLRALRGIGPWTAQYVAMRALGHPDAFPANDIVLRKVADPTRVLSGRELERRAEAWRPWRAYAVMYLWRDAARVRALADKNRRPRDA